MRWLKHHSFWLTHYGLFVPLQLPRAQIIVLPLLFAAGMTLVDSLDSIFMLHAYALPGRPEGAKSWWSGLRLFERTDEAEGVEALEGETRGNTLPMVNQDKLLTVSVVLTVLSITVALLISIVSYWLSPPVRNAVTDFMPQ